MKSIRVYAPASVANVGCGFDVLGFALEEPGDELELRLGGLPGIRISNDTSFHSIPSAPEANCAGQALAAFFKAVDYHDGAEIIFRKKIKPGGGIGSSAASAAAVVYAANELFGNPFSDLELLKFGMAGEAVASGSEHADNVAPSLLGGFVLIRSYQPLDVIKLPYPRKMFCTLISPAVEVSTAEARKLLRPEVELKKAIQQWGNVAGLVAGLATSDFPLIGRSLQDVIAEPARSALIPGYFNVKEAAMDHGALGCNISGSGPSVFALCEEWDAAVKVSEAMQSEFKKVNIASEKFISRINRQGTYILN